MACCVAADHVRDGHVHVVHDDGQVVGGVTVGAQDHEILDGRAVEGDGAVDGVVERRPARANFDSQRPRRSLSLQHRLLVGGQAQAGPVVLPRLAAGLRRLALGAQAFGGTVAVVGVSVLPQSLGGCSMPINPLRLEVRRMGAADQRALIPVQAQPAQAVQDAGDHIG